MSHRALIAVAGGDGRYDLYYSHDGGGDDRLAGFLARDRPPPNIGDGPPIARGLSLEGVTADHLDPIEHEALLVVDPDGEVEPFVVLPYVLATSEGLLEWEPGGVALSLVGRDGGTFHPAFVRGWFQGTAGVLGEAIDAAVLAPEEAFGWLDDGIRRLAGDSHPSLVVP